MLISLLCFFDSACCSLAREICERMPFLQFSFLFFFCFNLLTKTLLISAALELLKLFLVGLDIDG